MLSVIKTAIVTIIISFISGVLLDRYKNLAPRIVCTLGKSKNTVLDNIEYKVYILNVKNTSNKTIHNLNLNVQSTCGNLIIDEAQITKGLRFDLSNENNIYNVSIPFLSKNDILSTKILIEDIDETDNKPIIALRSPEKFKKTYSETHKECSSLLDDSNSVHNLESGSRFGQAIKNFFENKKAIIAVAAIFLLVYVGISAIEPIVEGSNTNSTVEDQNDNETDVEKESNDTTNSTNNGTTKPSTQNSSSGTTSTGKQSSSGTTNNTNSGTSSNESNITNSSAKEETNSSSSIDESKNAANESDTNSNTNTKNENSQTSSEKLDSNKESEKNTSSESSKESQSTEKQTSGTTSTESTNTKAAETK